MAETELSNFWHYYYLEREFLAVEAWLFLVQFPSILLQQWAWRWNSAHRLLIDCSQVRSSPKDIWSFSELVWIPQSIHLLKSWRELSSWEVLKNPLGIQPTSYMQGLNPGDVQLIMHRLLNGILDFYKAISNCGMEMIVQDYKVMTWIWQNTTI